MHRINFLDGFRGFAICLVILYHAFTRWPEFVPYDNEYSEFVFFNKGFLGVQLFFLISGFVILMTLEKSNNFFEFIKKRWLRLFPAMLIATILIFCTSKYLPERPNGLPKLSSVVPGLFFIEPSWVSFITRSKITALEGSFWSLYVEVKYYFIFGLLYFCFDRIKAIVGIFICYLFWLALRILIFTKLFTFNIFIDFIESDLSFIYFGWFASGSLAYLYFVYKDKKYLYYSLITGFLSILSLGLSILGNLLAGIVILLIFISTVYFEFPKKIFSNRLFLFLGFVSYPLYLIHENAMISLIVKTNKYFSKMPDILLPIIPILILVMVSYYIVKVIEPLLNMILKNSFLIGESGSLKKINLRLKK